MKTTIWLEGCDATTTFEMDLTEAELDLVKRMQVVAEAAREYGCHPRILIEEER